MAGLVESWPQLLFWLLAVGTVACSIGVVAAQDIVWCVLWLLFALGLTSGLYFLMGADFVGAAQLLVYVGGTLVLVVFGVMLTSRVPFLRTQTAAWDWRIATVAGVAFLVLLLFAIGASQWPVAQGPGQLEQDTAEAAARSPNAARIGLAFLGLRTPDQQPGGDPTRVGYLLPFEIVSVHLLVVLIGAAYLARAKRRRRSEG